MNRRPLPPMNPRLLSWARSAIAAAVYALSGVFLTGCNQNPATTPTAQATSPYGSPQQSAYLASLQKQAAQQAQLAADQQAKINELQALQRQYDAQILAMQQQQQYQAKSTAQQQSTRNDELARQAQEAMGRYGELGQRARQLDRSNQDLYAQLAQIEQRAQLLDDQNHLLRQRLKETSDQLAASLRSSDTAQQQFQALQASVRRRSGASITANNSFRRGLTAVTMEGLSIRQDGEVVRIELSSDQLFEPGTANLRAGSQAMIDPVADVLLRNYPRQIVGVEAHTDNMPLTGTLWRSPHQLTAAQAMAVFEYLSSRQQLLSQQMFVLGHGANYPVASNATPAGQASNRRVEIVVYPEVVGQR